MSAHHSGIEHPATRETREDRAFGFERALPAASWMDTRPALMPGTFCHPAKAETLNSLGLPNAHAWNPADEDWNLPENWGTKQER